MFLRIWRTQQIGWMIGGQNLATSPLIELTSHATNRLFCIEKCLGRDTAQAVNEFGLQNLQLPDGEITAVSQLSFLWISVAWRTTLKSIQDVNVISAQFANFHRAKNGTFFVLTPFLFTFFVCDFLAFTGFMEALFSV